MTKYRVIYYKSGTGLQAAPPTAYTTRDEAIRQATAFNRTNQDQTWNAVHADIQPAQMTRNGYVKR